MREAQGAPTSFRASRRASSGVLPSGTEYFCPARRKTGSMPRHSSNLNVVDYRYRFLRNFSELIDEVPRDLAALPFALLMQIRDE